MSLRLVVPADPADPDPLPRPAAVGTGSAYAGVAVATAVPPTAVRLTAAPPPTGDRRRRQLPEWTFEPLDPAVDEPVPPVPVTVPHTWSRREPGFADFRGPARYRRRLRSDARRARLVFDAVDYLASVEVDGQLIVRHEGGFTPVAVELPTGRECGLAVTVDDPVETALLGTADPLLLAKAKIKGSHEWHDSRPGGMAVTPYDPVWVQRWGSGGISRPVWLHESGPVRIDALFVTAQPGSLRLSWVLDSVGPVLVQLHAALDGQHVLIEAALPAGAARVSVRLQTSGELRWTPEQPHLYQLSSAVCVGDEVSDAITVPVGFRQVQMALDGELPMLLHLDGEPHYVRAANYIPGAWVDEVTAELLERDVQLAVAAGLNSLGVHAGVWPELLPITDGSGVLVYQDFPMQWSYDPQRGPLFDGGDGLAGASLALAAELCYLLYNHPSLVYWCAHNEPGYQLREAFESAGTVELAALLKTLQTLPDEDALDAERAGLFARIDPTRPVTAASGLGVSRQVGDVHDYSGSLSGGSALRAGTDRHGFVSEFGAWSANFSAASFEHDWHAQTHLVATQEAYAGRRERYADFPTWCFAGQLWAGWHAKVVTEKARLHRYAPSVAVRYHFFLDHYGHGGAGMVDRHRTTGPGYRGLAAANRPLLAIAPLPAMGRVEPGSEVVLPIVVVNDLHTADRMVPVRWRLAALGEQDAFLVGRDSPSAPGPLQGEIAPLDQVAVLPRGTGSTIAQGESELLIEPDSATMVTELRWTADRTGPIALFLDVDGVVNWTTFMVEPQGWQPVPGLAGPRRFRVTADEPAPLVRRWTGEAVDPAAAPPDQYLFGGQPIDVYDEVHVHADGRISTAALPFPDPLRSGVQE